MLRYDIEPGQKIELPGVGTIRCVHKSGRRTRLEFDLEPSQRVVVVKAEGICEEQIEELARAR
jgi:hypothetical protein